MPNTARFSSRTRLSIALIAALFAVSVFLHQRMQSSHAVSTTLVINEIDYDQPSTDTAEFIELKNISASTINLDNYALELVNGTGGGAAIYQTIDLPNVNLVAGDYYVICANTATVANCDLDVSPNTDLVQNGAPDGVGIRLSGVLQDAVSYEGNTGAPYTESSGVGLLDDASANTGISRCGDGVDTDVNNVDLSLKSITPGATNSCLGGDTAPSVSSTNPAAGATGVPPADNITITFSEPVSVSGNWFQIGCGTSGTRNVADTVVTGGPTIYTINPTTDFSNSETCTMTVFAAQVLDQDTNDPPDSMASNRVFSFTIAGPTEPVAENVVINEVDSDTLGDDSAEFVELFDGGVGNTSLTGLVVVFFNGNGDVAYEAFDLDGHTTNAQGYFTIGNPGVPGVDVTFSPTSSSALQNGADAVALYAGNAADFGDGTAVTTSNLRDAIVYGTNDGDDTGLLVLLNAGQPQVDEDNEGDKDFNSNQRCPDGTGGARNTSTYSQAAPTSDGPNVCTPPPPSPTPTPAGEQGPSVLFTSPGTNGTNAPRDASITVGFSEPVNVTTPWYNIHCISTGLHNSATVAGGPSTYVITPNVNFLAGETCTVTIFKDQVQDVDADDGAPNTNTMAADKTWSFTVATGTAPPYLPDVHLTMGNPSGATEDINQHANYLMEKPEFTLSYNRDRGGPNWVSWHLSTEWFGTLPRRDTFRPDPQVPPDWYRVQATDFSGSGFDRGHNVPNADRDKETSIPINQATFLMSNMIPQAPDQNQGPWANMENDLRTIITQGNEMYIVMGGHGEGGTGRNGFAETIANGKVTVPETTWRVMLVLPVGENDVSRVNCSSRTIAVIMPNSNTFNGSTIRDDNWQDFIVSVDAVETLTGYDFFSNLPEPFQRCVEAGINGNNPPLDTDNDGQPDITDTDDDNDGFSDADETTAGSDPLNANSTPEVCDGVDNDLNQGIDEGFPNTDGDAQADCVDPDDDNDGVLDGVDLCPGTPSGTQVNAAGCPDVDGDGVADTVDNCKFVANADQTDTDTDGFGDSCDLDDDNDTVLDGDDNCPLSANPLQEDFDLDGAGDVCDPITGPPVNKDQCKDGGWERFNSPEFRNQGQCVAYVNALPQP